MPVQAKPMPRKVEHRMQARNPLIHASEAKSSPSDAAYDAAQTLSPAVRRAVLEHGLDPSTIKGSGKDGRLTKEDVLSAAKAKRASGDNIAPAAPAQAQQVAGGGSDGGADAGTAKGAASTGERNEERVKMTRMRQTIAKRLKGAQDNAALLTTFNDCDMSAVIEARSKYKDLFAKKHDIKLGFMGFFAKAACLALKDVPPPTRISRETRSSITITSISRSQ